MKRQDLVDFENTQEVRTYFESLRTRQEFPQVLERLTQVRARLTRLGEREEEYSDAEIIEPCLEFSSFYAHLRSLKLGRKTVQRIQTMPIRGRAQLYLAYLEYLKTHNENGTFEGMDPDTARKFREAEEALGIAPIQDEEARQAVAGFGHFNEKLIIYTKKGLCTEELARAAEIVRTKLAS